MNCRGTKPRCHLSLAQVDHHLPQTLPTDIVTGHPASHTATLNLLDSGKRIH